MAKAKARSAKAAEKVEREDIELARLLVPLRNTRAVKALGPVAELTDQPPLYALCGAVIAVGLGSGNARVQRAGARMLAAHAAAIFAKNVFKRSVDRTRPASLGSSGKYERGPGKRFDSAYNSFPSGHTASAIAVARAFGREYPAVAAQAVGTAALLGSLQVIRSKHFLSDVAAGASLGLIAEGLVDQLFRRLHPDAD
jgi:membrane-associated phospholipid phosphatase